MKKNLLKWTALFMMTITTITVIANQSSRDPYIRPFSCPKGQIWSDSWKTCTSDMDIVDNLDPIVGLILSADNVIIGACKYHPYTKCKVKLSDGTSLEKGESYETLYIQLNENKSITEK